MHWDVYALRNDGGSYVRHSVEADDEVDLLARISALKMIGTFRAYPKANSCVVRAHTEVSYIMERLA